ncbi:YWTD domain-containing protein [Rhizodiscina lignyota]|uniref:YWTD domain-containing protein n=1 Tax=Rhizodiscina lignyota TaxID=1504668 RepID=A0A9P4M8Y7_9PEZI|nr:YWTD domain-containing protein [Rhizodiscina lignyota]
MAAPMLYFLDIGWAADPKIIIPHGRILKGTADQAPLVTLVGGEDAPDGIDVCHANQRLYWTCMGIPDQNDGAVRSCRLDGTDIQYVVPRGAVHTPKQIFINESGPKPMLYFCDREGMRVWRCYVDGDNLEILYQAGDQSNPADVMDKRHHCVGVGVAPKQGKVYFTLKGPSKGKLGRLMRISMTMPEGCTPTTRSDVECIFDHLPEPIDIDIDEAGGWLYWSDRGELPLGNSVNRIRLSKIDELLASGMEPSRRAGPGVYQILARNLHEAVGVKLDVVDRHVYTTDLGGAVYRFDIDHGEHEEKTGTCRIYDRQGDGAFTGIALWRPS